MLESHSHLIRTSPGTTDRLNITWTTSSFCSSSRSAQNLLRCETAYSTKNASVPQRAAALIGYRQLTGKLVPVKRKQCCIAARMPSSASVLLCIFVSVIGCSSETVATSALTCTETASTQQIHSSKNFVWYWGWAHIGQS